MNVSHDPSHTSSTLSATSDLFIDDLMNRAYGATLINSDGGSRILLDVSDGQALSSFLVVIIPFLVVQLAKGMLIY